MILTNCAACAAPLGLSSGKKCGRCSTRYCGAECQKQHWESGGHDKLCKLIKKAGGAEQYNANNKCTEAVAVAVEKCAEDTKGQTCYICTQAVHWKTKEGLVRGCACRGTAGFAHVSCLAEQAKILIAEAEENNLTDKVNERWQRWLTCSLCEQEYHGLVGCALGWACWKTYAGRPEEDMARRFAMSVLGNGLSDAKHHKDALSVRDNEDGADTNMETQLIQRALKSALAWREPANEIVHHSDRGSQYASHAYQDALATRGIRSSMSRAGDCWDNAMIESLFGTYKQEWAHHHRWRGLVDARAATHDYIEGFYNRERLHSSLGYRTPMEADEAAA